MNQKLRGRIYWSAFLLSCAFLIFMAGFSVSTLQCFPYSLIYPPLHQLYHWNDEKTIFRSNQYVAATYSRSGVVRYDPERAYNGYTLFTSAHFQGAFLVDMKGDIVHQWHLPYDRIWKKSSGVEYPMIPGSLLWRDVHLYPNGDLLAVYEAFGNAIFGRGLVKMDRNSHPIWSYLDYVHHDVTVGPDGRIYTLTQTWRTKPIPAFPGIETPCTEDFVIVLSPDGKLLKKVSIYDAFARSNYRGMMKLLVYSIIGDTVHTNSVKPLPPAFAREFPEAGPNTVMISSRHLDAVALVDLDAEKVVWFLRGPWARQHDAWPLANGDVLLFDDLGDFAHNGHSRVLEFEPKPFKMVWEYPGDSGETLSSLIFGAAQKLPNGNVLITDSGTARLLEVTPDKKVVWEYRSPFLFGGHHQYAAALNAGQRFAPGDIGFALYHPAPAKSANARGRVLQTTAH